MATVGTMLVKIDGGSIDEVDDTSDSWTLPMIEIGRQSYYIAADSEEAGEAVRERYRDMDRRELRELIGDERLISWGLGESDDFGIRSMEDFIDAIGRVPEEDLASYDGSEREARINLPLAEEIDVNTDGDAKLDAAALRESLMDGDIPIPDELRAANPGIDADPETMDEAAANQWVALLIASEGSDSLDADGSIAAILDTFRFVACVAYRHN